jgi:hypothetical protein
MVEPGACGKQEEGIWIHGDDTGRRVFICRDKDCKKHASGSSYSRSMSSPAQQADRKKLLAKVRAQKAYRLSLLKAIVEAPEAKVALVVDKLLTEVLVNAIKRSDRTKFKAFSEVTGLSQTALENHNATKLTAELREENPNQRVLLGVAAIHLGELQVYEHSLSSKPEDLERLAGLLGVDAKKLLEEAKPAEPKKDAAPVAKKPILTPAVKKRIAAAQRKRWAKNKVK